MTNKGFSKITLALGAAAMAANKVRAEIDADAVDRALKTLKTYDWGSDRESLNPIDRAVIATQNDPAARQTLEEGLADVLASGLSRSAQDYVCRKLRVVGTARSIATLAALLPDEKTSHIARYALARIPDAKASDALREALPNVSNKLKPGIIGSLGVRRDKKSVEAISDFLGDSDVQIAQAAAYSLGVIGSKASATSLSRFAKKAPSNMKMPVADACLMCAERLLADGMKTEALALYKELKSGDQSKHVKVAATKGMVIAAAKK
jgi:HEAT repeat protein